MSLLELQRSFCSSLLDSPSDIRERLAGKAETGLPVYRNAYRLRLRECLRETYEKTLAWLGDGRFDAAADAHIEAHRPRSWTLADYGSGFAETLAALHVDAPEAAELAWLEWAMRRAFDGADAPPSDTDAPAAIDWDGAALRFAPTLTAHSAATNCSAIWAAISEGRTPPAATALPIPAALCVWRRDLSTRFRTIEGEELRMLRLALAGIPLGEICRLVPSEPDEADIIRSLGGLLARWLQEGMLVAPAAVSSVNKP